MADPLTLTLFVILAALWVRTLVQELRDPSYCPYPLVNRLIDTSVIVADIGLVVWMWTEYPDRWVIADWFLAILVIVNAALVLLCAWVANRRSMKAQSPIS